MDTFTYTISQPELPPVSSLGSWAELSIAKNKDWDKGSFKPWYADMLPYNPRDPYGMKRQASSSDKKAQEKQPQEEQKSEGAKAEKPSAAASPSRPVKYAKLVTASMRRLLSKMGL